MLHPSVFGILQNTAPGRGGEIQLTDALPTLAAGEGEKSGGYGVVFKGRRFDTGDKLSYLKAVITLASERVEFGEDLKTWLKAYIG
ncbi:UNVERIFIED_ORG: UTP-glucose-1-phosphate uridylyltransferase [Arthrobacter sp. UYCu721]